MIKKNLRSLKHFPYDKDQIMIRKIIMSTFIEIVAIIFQRKQFLKFKGTCNVELGEVTYNFVNFWNFLMNIFKE